MAYITKHNFDKIFNDRFHYDSTKKVEGTIEIMEPIGCYYSEREMQVLLAYREFVKDLVRFFGMYKIPFRDTYTYVWENPPAYHNNCNCELLRSDYSGKGAKIPDEIRRLGRDKIEEYRRFYKSNRTLHDIDPYAFFRKVNLYFHTSISREEIDSDHAPNSGAKRIPNVSLEKMIEVFNRNIEVLLKYWNNHIVICNNFAKRSYYITNYVRKHGLNVFYTSTDNMSNTIGKVFNGTEFSNELVIKKVKEIQFMKTTMSNQVKDIILKQYNPAVSMDMTLLDALGFKRCSKCISNIIKTMGTDLLK